MKLKEIAARYVKARIMSWLHHGQFGAVLPLTNGDSVVMAVYSNGRYVEPETVSIPDSPQELWGPDGPVNMGGGEEQGGSSPE